jgi:hypothetical protein
MVLVSASKEAASDYYGKEDETIAVPDVIAFHGSQ